MEQSGVNKYAGNTTRQLEDLLRQGLPEAEARLVQSELERRYSEALGPPQTPSGHQRPRVEMPPPPATQSSRNPGGPRPAWQPGQPSPIGGPAQQPLSRPPVRSTTGFGAAKKIGIAGCAGVIVMFVMLIAVTSMCSSRVTTTTSRPSMSARCQFRIANVQNFCIYPSALPVGSSCVCNNGVSTFRGTIQ